MKTIKEWFESVENPILRKVLLMRMNSNEDEMKSLHGSVFMGIDWSKTPENYHFWESIWNELKKSNESPTFNAKYPVMQIEWLDENECIWCETEDEKKYIQTLLYQNDIKYGGTGHVDRVDYYYLPKCHWMDVKTFNPKNYTVYPAKLFVKDMKQDLLEEAKCRYPVGCKFKTVEKFYGLDESVITEIKLGYNSLKEKDTDDDFYIYSNNATIYYNNQWAEYVEVFGFKVGDVIDKDILNEWIELHEEYNSATKKWFICESKWNWSPSIQAIDFIDNTIVFKIGNIVWIKAEGLREFTELEKLKQNTEKAEKEFINCLNEFEQSFLQGIKKHEEIEKNHLDYIKNRNNMKPQTLTLGQLKDLNTKGNCIQWETMISRYIQPNWRKKDTEIIEIDNADIYYAKKHASKAQLKLLQDAGLKFEEECSFKIGDWVVVLPEDEYYGNCEQGKAQQIQNITKCEYCPYDLKFSNGTWNSYKLIRKATEAEIKYAQIEWNKLKTGSHVKLKNIKDTTLWIVLHNSEWYINNKKQFCVDINGEEYTTFNYIKIENDCHSSNYIHYLSHNIKEIITEVISY